VMQLKQSVASVIGCGKANLADVMMIFQNNFVSYWSKALLNSFGWHG
jgi:hypothetical protein